MIRWSETLPRSPAGAGRPRPRYDWPLDFLDGESEREIWGNQSLIKAWFGIFKFRTRRFWHRFPHYSTTSSTESWLTAFAVLYNATL